MEVRRRHIYNEKIKRGRKANDSQVINSPSDHEEKEHVPVTTKEVQARECS